MKFVFQYGAFGVPTISAGEYAWPQLYADPTGDGDGFVDNTNSQLYWCDPAGEPCNYLDGFYTAGWNSGVPRLTIGALYSGFDDTWASWGSDRVISQQCGEILIKTANEVTALGNWTTTKIPYMLLATWNDYEEGTENESGIDNCYDGPQVSYQTNSQTVIQWSLVAKSGTSPNPNTIHHYVVWVEPSGHTTLTSVFTSTSATTYDLTQAGLNPGQYTVYVEAVGQPSIQNEMSTGLAYTQQ